MCAHRARSPPSLHASTSLPVQVVNFAYLRSPAEAFPWAALQLRRMHHGLELWQVSRTARCIPLNDQAGAQTGRMAGHP